MNQSSIARKTAYMGLFTAVGLILSYVEALIPFHFGIPGMKLGLANIMVLLAMETVGYLPALFINLLRILLAGFLFGNLYSILYSLAGAFCSFLVMLMLHKFRFGLLGISSGGGISHNIGQLVVAACVVETWNILYYGPVLLIFGIVTGLLNGFICSLLLPYLKKMQKGS